MDDLDEIIAVNRGDFLIYRWKGMHDGVCRRIGDLVHLLHRSLFRASPYEPGPLPVPSQYVATPGYVEWLLNLNVSQLYTAIATMYPESSE